MATHSLDFPRHEPKITPLMGLVGFIMLCLLAAAVGGLLAQHGMSGFYPSLAKPSWNPPQWLFGPVWTVLYVMMAVAGWLVWREQGMGGPALRWFYAQLALNVGWSFCFFYLEDPLYGAIEIVALWAAIAVTTVLFFRARRAAGALMVPYLAWVSFASVLSITIYLLNK